MKLCSRSHRFAVGIATLSLSALLGAVVRAKAPPGQYQYQAASDTVVDLKTRLNWQRTATSPKTFNAGSTAAQHCEALNLGGFSEGWRVPTRKELETLVDTSANSSSGVTIDEDAFPGTAKAQFCTSTLALEPNGSWVVNFALGGSYLVFPPNDQCWLRCVHSVP